MPTPLPTPPVPPKIPTGQELYDTLMTHFEPELVSAVAPTLVEKYKNESAEDNADRMKRYELAFERCDQAYNDYIQTLDAQVGRYQRAAFRYAEMSDRQQDEGFLDHLGNLFHSAA